MKLIADTHMHTIASCHAYSTLQEMIHAASLAGLSYAAVTDHGAGMPGSPGKWYFKNMKVLPRILEGVHVLRGEEADVLDFEGTVDLDKDEVGTLDWIVASMHGICMEDKNPTVEKVTHAWLKIAENPLINVIGHSGTQAFQYDYKAVIPEFGKNGKLVELNEGTFYGREKSVPNCVRIMQLCKKYGVPVIVNSDAHFSARVGRFEHSLKLLEELDFPEELVVNSSVERFRSYLKLYTHVFEDPEFI